MSDVDERDVIIDLRRQLAEVKKEREVARRHRDAAQQRERILKTNLADAELRASMAEEQRGKLLEMNESLGRDARKRLADMEKRAQDAERGRDAWIGTAKENGKEIAALKRELTDAESRADAFVEAWREAKGFGDLRDGSEGWKSVQRMDAALTAYVTQKKGTTT